MTDFRFIKGPVGEARQVPRHLQDGRSDWAATIDCWVVHAPGHSTAWEHFTMAIIHLREIDGVPPAYHTYPGSEYELIVAALDPEHPIDFDSPELQSFQWLTPFNVIEQFHDVDDTKAAEILERLVEDAVQGQAPLEPEGIRGGREWWRDRLRALGAALL